MKAIINHTGSANSGHYYSFICLGDSWYSLSDTHVERCDKQKVIKFAKGLDPNAPSSNAYCLFYTKSLPTRTLTVRVFRN